MSAAMPEHPVLRTLLAYWNRKRGERPMPTRRDIDPLEMAPRLLPHLLLSDLGERGTRARFRLVGTEAVARFGLDPTGHFLEDRLTGHYADTLAALHRAVFCERAPVYSESVFRWGGKHALEASHLLLPLTHGGPEPAIALIGLAIRATESSRHRLGLFQPLAAHAETCRAVLRPPYAAEAAASGRNVA